jgi:hypothetical protein
MDEPVERTVATGAEQTNSLYAERPRSEQRRLVRRPPELWVGAIFLTLAALPLIVLGGGLAVQPGQIGTNLRDKITAAGAAAGPDSLLMGLRIGGVVILLLAVLMLALTWLAVRPRRKARLGAAVLATLEAVGLAATMAFTAPDPVSIGVLLLVIAGVALLYLPRSEEFMYTGR